MNIDCRLMQGLTHPNNARSRHSECTHEESIGDRSLAQLDGFLAEYRSE
jgi:hypothetical protein